MQIFIIVILSRIIVIVVITFAWHPRVGGHAYGDHIAGAKVWSVIAPARRGCCAGPRPWEGQASRSEAFWAPGPGMPTHLPEGVCFSEHLPWSSPAGARVSTWGPQQGRSELHPGRRAWWRLCEACGGLPMLLSGEQRESYIRKVQENWEKPEMKGCKRGWRALGRAGVDRARRASEGGG